MRQSSYSSISILARTRQSYNFEHKYFQGSVKTAKSSKFCILDNKPPYSVYTTGAVNKKLML